MKTDAEKREIGLQAAMKMVPSGPNHDSHVNLMRARFVAHDERTEEEGPIPLILNETSRDRLMFNGRQDVAHALLNTITILERTRRIERKLNFLIAAVVVATIAIVYALLKTP
jgi:hypothetical protein